MKKNYVKPKMEVVEIVYGQILCMSGEVMINGFQDDEEILDAI